MPCFAQISLSIPDYAVTSASIHDTFYSTADSLPTHYIIHGTHSGRRDSWLTNAPIVDQWEGTILHSIDRQRFVRLQGPSLQIAPTTAQTAGCVAGCEPH